MARDEGGVNPALQFAILPTPLIDKHNTPPQIPNWTITERNMYLFEPKATLDRATSRLASSRSEELFYAALELRFFVEARQNQYLEAQDKYRQSLPKPYHIGKQANELKRIFSPNKVQSILWTCDDGWEYRFEYIPVSIDLTNRAEKLGELLHFQTYSPSQNWLGEKRAFLGEMLELAQICSTGNLLSPALISTGEKIVGHLACDVPNEVADRIERLNNSAKKFKMLVSYRDI